MELTPQGRLSLYILLLGIGVLVYRRASAFLRERAREQRWRLEQESRPPSFRQRPAATASTGNMSPAMLEPEQERRPTATPARLPLAHRPSLPFTPLHPTPLHRSHSLTTPLARGPTPMALARSSTPVDMAHHMDASVSFPSIRLPSPSHSQQHHNGEPSAVQDITRPGPAQQRPRGMKRSASMSTEVGDLVQPLVRRRKLVSGEEMEDDGADELMSDAEAAVSGADDSSDESVPDPSNVVNQPSHRGLVAMSPAKERSSSRKGKARSSSARHQQVNLDLKTAAAKFKRRARLPGDGVRKNLHRVEEEALPALPPGDTAEDLEGVQWRMGDDGRLRRLELLRTTRKKFDMPRDSTHPDAVVTEAVYTEHWLTTEEFDRAKLDHLLLSQKDEYEAEEAKRLEAEAIILQKREDRQRRKIAKQTEEARLTLERRRDVDRRLWGHLIDRRDTSHESEEDSILGTRTHGSGSVASSTSPGIAPRRARPSDFAPSPNISLNGSFRPRKRNEQRFHMETQVASLMESAPSSASAPAPSSASVPTFQGQASTPTAPAPEAPGAAASAATPSKEPASSTPFSFGKKTETQATVPSPGSMPPEQPSTSFSFKAPANSATEDKPAENPKPVFSLGAPAAGTTPAEPPKTSFSFGTTSTETKAAEAPKPSAPFSFGTAAKPDGLDDAPKPKFSLGSVSEAQPPAASAPPTSNVKPMFSFGADPGSAAAAAAASPSGKPVFSFGVPAAAASAAPSAPTPAPKFTFGAPSPNTVVPASNPASTSTASTFQFGLPSSTETGSEDTKPPGFKSSVPSFNAGTK